MSTPIARRRLDENLATATVTPRPHRGWIRAIREALGMSTADLGRRMGISQQSVTNLERNEENWRLRLDSLVRAADAMNCDLVYTLVPRTSLDETVRQQARKKARQLVGDVAHHSRLEDQTVSAKELAAQIDEIAAELVNRRGLWRDEPTP